MYTLTEDVIRYTENVKRDLSYIMHTYVTVHNMDNMSSERVFVAFMNAINHLIDMDASEVANGCQYHYEWRAKHCWDRLHSEYKEQILAAVPDIHDYMEWRTTPHDTTPFLLFKTNAFMRVVDFEKAEIIKRAQTKMLKEEIAMKVMHPDRIKKVATAYGLHFDEYLEILD